MKAAMEGLISSKIYDSQVNGKHITITALANKYADAALAEFEARWPEDVVTGNSESLAPILSSKNSKDCCGSDTCTKGMRKGCNGAHCRCMNLDGECRNMHYVECSEHYKHF